MDWKEGEIETKFSFFPTLMYTYNRTWIHTNTWIKYILCLMTANIYQIFLKEWLQIFTKYIFKDKSQNIYESWPLKMAKLRLFYWHLLHFLYPSHFLRLFRSIVFLHLLDQTHFLCWLTDKIFYVGQSQPLFPLSRYCKYSKNSVYVHILCF